jgi:AcrR family transcriptional regulator
MGAMESLRVSARPRRADAVRNRTRIIEAAGKLMATSGLATQMVDVAQLAGVGVGTLYRNFATREDLVDAVLEDVHRRLISECRELLSSEDPGEAFVSFVFVLGDAVAANAALAEDASAQRQLNPRAYDIEFRQIVADLLARAQTAGAIRVDVGVSDLQALMSAVARLARRASLSRTSPRRYLTLMLDALITPMPTPLP